MQLPRLALKNTQFTFLIVMLLVAIGILSYNTMPRSEDPQFNMPITLVEVIYPGASALDVETLVVDPIEAAISDLDNIEKIATDIKNGGTRLEVTFIYGSDPDASYNDVVRVVGAIRSELPEEIQLLFFKASPTSVNIMQLALSSSPVDMRKIGIHADRLQKRLERFPEIRKAEIWGLPLQVVEVKADPQRLQQNGISYAQLAQKLAQRADNITPGFVDLGTRRLNVQASGNFSDVQQVKDTVVRVGNASSVTVSDVAQVQFASYQPDYLAYFDDKPVVFLSVEQRAGTNIFEVTKKLNQEIELFSKSLPEDVSIEMVFDQSESVEKRVNGFFENLLQGLVLVGLISLIFLGFREALIITITVPISFVIAIGWLDFSGFGLEQMSIVGLIIALGLLVDDAIVVTESIHRVKPDSKSLKDAAIKGAERIAWASASGTITTVLAFLPMLMLNSASGDFMRSMPVTVSLVLIASLLLSLSLTPLLASYLLKPGKSSRWALQYLLNRFAVVVYRPILSFCCRFSLLVIVVALVALGFGLSLFPQVGVALFPKAEKPILLVSIETPSNTSIYQTDRVAQEISRGLMSNQQVSRVAINVGNANPRIYYNQVPRRGEANFAQMLVILNEYDYTKTQKLISELRDEYSRFAGARVNVEEFQQGPVTDPPVTFRLMSDDIEQLSVYAALLESKLRSIDGAINIKNLINEPQIELGLEINYAALEQAEITVDGLDQSVRGMLRGQFVGQLKDKNGLNYPVLTISGGTELASLNQLQLQNQQGQFIPLTQFAKPTMRESHPEFYHYQKIRTAKVSADVAAGYSVNEITQELESALIELQLPIDIRYEIGGEEESRQENFSGLAQVMLIAGVGIFAVLVLQFRSLVQPLVIFTSVPFAIAGAVLGLYIAKLPFSIMAFVGLISLFGIVVNNAIILVDTSNYFRRKGIDKTEAVLIASATRFTPIILTSLTTIAGLIPLTLYGGVLWMPLGLVIICGLICSSFSSLILVPLLTRLLSR
ncbi:efflux RND transporter permease subunit [Alginatibacterium sediminis]|uniref:Efflux RND transporter permease subunit n=1 Tax=Alginatibacterium sediminis TaxID=2164068 RepID=A0A420E749_9ALTE|nr:efflux RND transporter permease subunit [Alginatibacterium sediminis]RKF14371.1 efflux RND transporter permease subunit [Alginatibacterium sediminis]